MFRPALHCFLRAGGNCGTGHSTELAVPRSLLAISEAASYKGKLATVSAARFERIPRHELVGSRDTALRILSAPPRRGSPVCWPRRRRGQEPSCEGAVVGCETSSISLAVCAKKNPELLDSF